MTNKEAIFKLIEYRRMLERNSEIDVEPFDMAIEALSKRDNAEPIPQWRGCMDGCLPYYDGRGERGNVK